MRIARVERLRARQRDLRCRRGIERLGRAGILFRARTVRPAGKEDGRAGTHRDGSKPVCVRREIAGPSTTSVPPHSQASTRWPSAVMWPLASWVRTREAQVSVAHGAAWRCRKKRLETIEKMQKVSDDSRFGFSTKRPNQDHGMNERTPLKAFTDGLKKTAAPSPKKPKGEPLATNPKQPSMTNENRAALTPPKARNCQMNNVFEQPISINCNYNSPISSFKSAITADPIDTSSDNTSMFFV